MDPLSFILPLLKFSNIPWFLLGWFAYSTIGRVFGEFWWRLWDGSKKDTFLAKVVFPFSAGNFDYGDVKSRYEPYCPGEVATFSRRDDKNAYLLVCALFWPIKLLYMFTKIIVKYTIPFFTTTIFMKLPSLPKIKNPFSRVRVEEPAGPQDELTELLAQQEKNKARIDQLRTELNLVGTSETMYRVDGVSATPKLPVPPTRRLVEYVE